MSELEVSESVFESVLGSAMEGSGGSAADPPGGMHEWWKTPASLVGPPVVDPAIYGIDASDVGGTVVDDVAASVAAKHQRPSDLNGLIGMSNAVSAQAGARAPSRKDHMLSSDGHRANAMSAQLLMAARRIEELRDKLDNSIRTKVGDRSADASTQLLLNVLADVKQERTMLSTVIKEQYKAKLNDRVVRDAFLHVSRASAQLDRKVNEAQLVARQNGATKDEIDSLATNSGFVANDVGKLAERLDMQGADDSKVQRVTEKESDLQIQSLSRSLEGLDDSSQALVMAAREPDPKTAMSEVLPGLLSNRRLLDASLVDDVRPTAAMVTKGKIIVARIEDAWMTAGANVQGDSNLSDAHSNTAHVIGKLEALSKKKKK